MYGDSLDDLRRDMIGIAYDDARVLTEIGTVYRERGYVLDPHGAIGWLAVNDALAEASPEAIGVFLATAHPAKFREVVEPAIGADLPLPPALADVVRRPRFSRMMDARYEDLLALLTT
jgi:threonine synthase